MERQDPDPQDQQVEQASQAAPPLCTCAQDPFAGLPPELRLKPKPLGGGLRQTMCPACGLKYWTNRETDVCVVCEKKRGKQWDPVGGA